VPEVRIAERRIWVGDASRALLSGEVHFWRLDVSMWRSVLQRLADLGLDMVSTYVCWDFHEVAPGSFDFGGARDPRRDLRGFLRLAADMGLWVLLRPGPYIYAEWPNSGIPERLVRYHRLHPAFVQEAKSWMAAVVESSLPFLATGGGPIVLWQADNEADPWLDVYAPQTLELFVEFLRRRYATVEDLNQAWSASFGDFSEARPVMAPIPRRWTPRYLDVCRFRHWYATEIVRWTTLEYRRLGVDVPIYANTYTGTSVQDQCAVDCVCDLAGPDIYPASDLADDAEAHRGLLDSVRYARSYALLPFSPEFESGIWHGWHARVGTLPAAQYELTALSALQAGIAGWNWYMLAARDSWYMSPITELGRFRPELAPTFAELTRLFRDLDPPSLEKLTDTAVTFNALERGAHLDEAGRAVLRALYAADVEYEVFDLHSSAISRPLLLYAGGSLLSLEQAQRLTNYVAGGGTLVVFQPDWPGPLHADPRHSDPVPTGPRKIDAVATDTGNFDPLAMGPRGIDGVWPGPNVVEPQAVTTAAAPQRLALRLGETRVELSSPAVFVYADPPGEPIVAERIRPLPPTQEGGHAHVQLPVGERLTIGYVAPSGAGRLVVIGVSPTPELLLAIHGWLGIRIACRANLDQRLHSALFQRGDEYVAIVTNTAAHAQDAVLHLDVPAPVPRTACDLRTELELRVTNNTVTVRVPARSGTAVRLS
jgi:Glycosyl hydrolases family 35